MNLISLFFTFFLLTAGAAQVSTAAEFVLCIDDRPWLPYTNPDPTKPGEMQILVAKITRDLGLGFHVVVLPWRRCLESVRSGKIDALIGVSDVPFTRELAEFPKIGNTTDTGRSLGTARIMLVKKRGSTASWNGTRLSNLKKPVAVSMGTQIMLKAVREAGGIADDGGKTDLQNIRKLLEERVDLMAAYEVDLRILLAKGFYDKVSILPIPLSEASYFLAFSKPYYTHNSETAEAIWNRIGTVRNANHSHEYRRSPYKFETSSAETPR